VRGDEALSRLGTDERAGRRARWPDVGEMAAALR